MDKGAFYKLYNGIVKKRYLLTGVIFFVWISVIDSNSWIDRLRLQKNLEKLETEKSFYQKKIKEDSVYLHELKTNKANLEKFAREKYLMKKENEDIFIIVIEKWLPLESVFSQKSFSHFISTLRSKQSSVLRRQLEVKTC